jgi:hypothetical protein
MTLGFSKQFYQWWGREVTSKLHLEEKFLKSHP